MVGYIADVAFYKVPDPPHVSNSSRKLQVYIKTDVLVITDYGLKLAPYVGFSVCSPIACLRTGLLLCKSTPWPINL
jgi:hypothetical protein